MDCGKIKKVLSPYLDGELNPVLAEKVASHLSGCPACRREFEAFMRLDRVLQDLPRYSMQAEFAEQLLDRLDSSGAAQAKRGPWRRAASFMLNELDRLLDLLGPAPAPSTGTLEEFNDIPSSFIGHAYFQIMR